MSGTWSYSGETNELIMVGAEMSPADLASARAAGATEQDIASLQGAILKFQVSQDKKSFGRSESFAGVTVSIGFTKSSS